VIVDRQHRRAGEFQARAHGRRAPRTSLAIAPRRTFTSILAVMLGMPISPSSSARAPGGSRHSRSIPRPPPWCSASASSRQPWLARLKDWESAGGKVTVKQARIEQRSGRALAHGTFGLDGGGLPADCGRRPRRRFSNAWPSRCSAKMDGRSRFRRAAGFCGTVPVIQVPALYPEPKPIEDPAPAATEPSWRGMRAGNGPVRVLAGC